MAGWGTIRRIRDLEQRAELLGMRFTAYKHDTVYGENIALVPMDQDALPIYTRDAVLFAGSLEAADQFMQGILWARNYDSMVVDKNIDAKRARKEQQERNQQLIRRLSDKKLDLVGT